jgi:hypothetical protein
MKAILKAIINFFIELFGGYVRPGEGTWKCCLFYPHKLHDVGGTPIWPGNRGVDSLMGVAYDAARNEPWQAAKRTNGLKWTQFYGGDTAFYIAEPLFNNPALQEYFTSENGIVKESRKYGIKRWVVAMFNDGPLPPASIREAHIKRLCDCYAWASKREVVFMTCLESEKNMTPAVAVDVCNVINKYAGGKRILVGTPKMDFHQAVHRIIQAQNAKPENKNNQLVVECWKETDCFPFDMNEADAKNYIAQLKELKLYGKVWAGEWGRGDADDLAESVTRQALELGCDCGSGFYK